MSVHKRKGDLATYVIWCSNCGKSLPQRISSVEKELEENFLYQLPSVSLPSCDLFPAHCKIDGVDLNAVARSISCFLLLQIPFVEFSV